MMGEIPPSAAQHWDILWLLVVALVSGAIGELRFALYILAKKQDQFIRAQSELPEKFASAKDLEKIEKDRTKMWEHYFFPHTHHPSGEVKIPLMPEK